MCSLFTCVLALVLHYHKAHIYTQRHGKLEPGVIHYLSALTALCIFMLGRGPSLNRGVTGARFGNLVFYCLRVGKWVLFQAEDEIRLCQEYWPPCLLPSLLEAYCSSED